MAFRNENQDTNEAGYEHYEQPYEYYDEYPMMYELQMTPYQNMPYQMPEYMGYDEDIMIPRNDGINDDKDGFRQYHNRPYQHRPYYPYHPYYHNPYYHQYYDRPYYNPYFNYGYGIPFLAGLALGSFF